MPELPEVETVVRTLEVQLKDAVIEHVDVLFEKIVENVSPEEFATRLQGQKFTTFERRGKYLLLGLSDEMLIVHLRMEGKFYIETENDPLEKHTHIVFHLSDQRELRYHDVRKFGRMNLYRLNEEYTCLNKLGLEPFDPALTPEYLKKHYRKISTPIKAELLDQSVIAGIGNIYANEICFLSGISPLRKSSSLTKKELSRIISSARSVLSTAIEAGGTTIRSYTSSLGVTGLFQLSLNVYQQKECPLCHGPITKVMNHERGTYYCSRCQK